QSADLSIPSKVFEYMTSPAWLLALADRSSATGQVLHQAGADVVAPTDVDGIERALDHRLQQFQETGRPQPLATSNPDLGRSVQARRFFQLISRLDLNGDGLSPSK
ncbi:MAG: hypothetical protein ABI647_00185, partial [Gemmatimonadota bacterium]